MNSYQVTTQDMPMDQMGAINLKECMQEFLLPARAEGGIHCLQFVILCIGLFILLETENCTTKTDMNITTKTSI